jgi:hypothetical protein
MTENSTNDVNADATATAPSTVDEETTNVDEPSDRLSDEASNLLSKYESSSDSKRQDLIAGLTKAKDNNSLRGWQKEALEALNDIHDVQIESVEYTQEEERELVVLKRNEAIRSQIKDLGVDETVESLQKNRDFIKKCRELENSGVDPKTATRVTLIELFQTTDKAKENKARQMTGVIKGKAPEVAKNVNPVLAALGYSQ